jgi:hypothetical protein
MSGINQTGDLPVTSVDPDQPIRSLAVRITTSNDLLSGTNDDVWLDIGPKAWKIGDDFDRGTTKTIAIDLIGKDDNLDIPAVVPLYVRDISQVRLEKKGLCGLTDAPDSVASALLPPLPTPANTIAALKQQVAYAQYALDQQQTLVGIQEKILQQQVQIIGSAQKEIASAQYDLANIPGQIANAKNQVLDVQRRLAQTPAQIAQRQCHTQSTAGRVILGVLTGGTSELVCGMVQIANPVWQSLTNTATSLAQSQTNLESQLAAATVRKAAALQTLATATVTKTAVEAQKKNDELQYSAAHKALDSAQLALADAEALAAKLPLSDLSLPTPGQWKIDRVVLIVNGHDLVTFDVGDTLKQRHAEWSHTVRQMPAGEQFVNGLRVNVNKASTVADERLARVTTLFKLSDISGWKGAPVSTARGVGSLVNPPSPGDDGFVSLDLELELIETMNNGFVLDGNSGIGHKRYIRVEYKNRDASGNVDERYKNWPVGTRLIVEAPVFWDTDRDGFYELHPDSPGQVDPLKPGESGATVPKWQGLAK